MKYLFFILGAILGAGGTVVAAISAREGWDGQVSGWVMFMGFLCLIAAFLIHIWDLEK